MRDSLQFKNEISYPVQVNYVYELELYYFNSIPQDVKFE